ncbi:MAG: hypothetical protein VKJ09_12345, partial [Leptolyngbya sp.]|nr:hypothetical protein [Leptolyngbya sp.]
KRIKKGQTAIAVCPFLMRFARALSPLPPVDSGIWAFCGGGAHSYVAIFTALPNPVNHDIATSRGG